MKALYPALLVAVIASAAPAADEKGDLGKLQGPWNATLEVAPGKKMAIVMLIKGSDVTMTMTAPDNDQVSHSVKGELKIDEKTRPKSWDLVNGKAEGRDVPDMKAIYELNGDTLRIAAAHGPNEDRPTEFKESDQGPPSIITFNREKAKSK